MSQITSPLAQAAESLRRFIRQNPKKYSFILSFLSVFILGVFVYPGAMSTDSIEQLVSERNHERGDWHPPFMGFLWGYIDKIHPGQWGMQILLLLIWGFFIYHIFCLLFSQASFAKSWLLSKTILILTLLHNPPMLGLLGTLWKDSFLAVIFPLAGIILCRYKGNIRFTLLAFFLLFLGSLFRHNSFPALIPFFAYGLFNISSKTFRASLGSCLAAFFLCVLSFALAGQINKQLINVASSWPLQQILLHDLVAIRRETSSPTLETVPAYKNVIPSQSTHTPGFYDPASVVPLYCCDPQLLYFSGLSTDSDRAALKKAWLKDVGTFPSIYLKHRLRVFSKLLSLNGESCMPFHWGITENTLGISLEKNYFSEIRLKIMGKLKNTFLFRGYFWIGINLLLLGFLLSNAFKKRSINLEATAFASAGFFYWLPYIFVATTCDLRMIYLTIVCNLTALLFIWKEYYFKAAQNN